MVTSMQMTDMLKPNIGFDLVVVYNRCGAYMNTVLNLFRRKYGISAKDTYVLQSLNDIDKHLETFLLKPLNSRYWLVYISDTNVMINNNTIKLLSELGNVKCLVGSSNFRVFQFYKGLRVSSTYVVESMYGSMLTKDEFTSLYNAVINGKGSSSLSPALVDYVQKGYLREPNEVFKLLSALKEGISFSNKSEIVGYIGVGNLSVEFTILGLLTSTSKTPRGISMLIRKVLRSFNELSIRRSYASIQASLLSSLKAMLIIKSLIVDGEIIVGLSESFDTAPYKNSSLSKYRLSVERISTVPLSKIIIALGLLGDSRWDSDLDLVQFVVGYVYRAYPRDIIEGIRNEVKGK